MNNLIHLIEKQCWASYFKKVIVLKATNVLHEDKYAKSNMFISWTINGL